MSVLNMTTGYFKESHAVIALDQMIEAAHAVAKSIANWKPNGPVTELEMAACRLAPQAIHIAASIRYEIDGAMILTSAVLLRPLIERAATLTFLAKYPERCSDWLNGSKKRPSFQEMVNTFSSGLDEIGSPDLIKELHTFVHASADNAWLSEVMSENGVPAIAVHQMPDRGHTADYVAMLAAVALLALLSEFPKLFPRVLTKVEIDDVLAIPIGALLATARAAIGESESES